MEHPTLKTLCMCACLCAHVRIRVSVCPCTSTPRQQRRVTSAGKMWRHQDTSRTTRRGQVSPLYGEEPAEVVTVVFEGDCEDTRGSKMLGRFTFTVVDEPGTTRIGALGGTKTSPFKASLGKFSCFVVSLESSTEIAPPSS